MVWVPVLGTDSLPDAATLALVPDHRASHYWDEAGTLGPAFKELLQLPGQTKGWDLYLLYPAGANWASLPPLPPYWQHQLGGPVESLAPRLDGAAMLGEARRLLTDLA